MLQAGLSMLWESADPVVALRDRFGFEDVESVAAWMSRNLAGVWGITAGECTRIVVSDQNAIAWVGSDGGDLVVKWSGDRERFPALQGSTRLLPVLAGWGVPVASPVAAAGGLVRVEVDGPVGTLSVTVLPEIEGSWLDVEDRASVLSAGAHLAKLHQALGFVRHDRQSSTGLKSRISTWLSHSDRGRAPAASRILAALLSGIGDLVDTPQLVHNDFRAANILTRNSEVCGILDFDEVTVDHRVNDLAKACTYLSTLFTDWRPTPPAVRQVFRAGYESVRPLGPSESQWLEILMLWHAIAAIPVDDSFGWASALGPVTST
ncbi:Ser/Thr protein kinase RdoA (MazF antagonist) [Rhodococcus sp. 27YEA15]|uniref:phosphotransferase enzyme family protein n=1 Tax=Rhodococcus sp. 27YEA15 TaxID=3156259 RepID=UPI003C7C66EC